METIAGPSISSDLIHKPNPKVFRKIGERVDVDAFIREIIAQGESIWLLNPSRQKGIIHHKDTQTLHLREPFRDKHSPMDLRAVHLSRETPLAQYLPKLMDFLYQFAIDQKSILGRVMVVRLQAGGEVGEHIDEGPYYECRRRYHLVLQSQRGSPFFAGSEQAIFRRGELWWFDNQLPHRATNPSDDWRIHVIFDLRPWATHPRSAPSENILAMNERLARLNYLILRRGLLFADKQHIVGPGGRPFHWMFDLRPLLMDTEFLNLLTDEFWRHYQAIYPNVQLVGLELTTLPLIGALVARAAEFGVKCSGAFVRKSHKRYGRQRLIEGDISNAPILAIDDSINSGASFEKINEALKAKGHQVSDFFSILNFQNPKTRELFAGLKITPTACFSLADFDLCIPSETVSSPSSDRFRMVFGYDAENGPHQPSSPTPRYNLALDATEDRVFFGTSGGSAHCLDALTGERLWHFKAPCVSRAAPFVILHRHLILIGCEDHLYALDQQSGQLLWQKPVDNPVGSFAAVADKDNSIYLIMSNKLGALDLNQGDLRWHSELECLNSCPAYSSAINSLGVGTNNHTFVAIDAQSGKLLWEQSVGGAVKQQALFFEGLFIFGSADGCIYGLDARTGQVRFRFQTGKGAFTTPLVVGSQIWVGSVDRTIYVIDAVQRRKIGKIETRARSFSSPVLIEGHIFVGTLSGHVDEYDPQNLKKLGSYQLPDRILTQVVYNRKHKIFYAGTPDDRLFALRREIV